MTKLELLKEVLKEENYTSQESDYVLKNISQAWLTFEQTKEEIKNQLYISYGIWRGLANAINDYVSLEKQI